MNSRVYVVEDHVLLRQGLVEYLTSLLGVQVCGLARTGEEALEQLGDCDANLVLVDMSLPYMSGAELVTEIRDRWPALPCLILSGHAERGYVQRAFDAGAQGYVLKGNPTELKAAIEEVLQGNSYVSTSLRSVGAAQA